MKQTLLMAALLLIGTVGSFVKGPFYGIAIYYLFAVLRPQYLWRWTLPPDIQWSLFVAIAAIAASFLRPTKDSRSGSLQPGGIAMLLFAIWVTLSCVFANNSDVAFQPYIEYLKIFIMFFISVRILGEFSQVRTLYLIILISLGYIAYEINSIYFLSGRIDIYNSGYGGLDNNGAGLMIAMGVPMAYFLWQGEKRLRKWLFLALIPIMLHAVLMTYSRGAMISLLVSSPLFVIRSINRKSAIAALLCLLMLLPFLAGKEIRDRFLSLGQYEQDESAQSRFDSWRAAIRIAMDYPVFGAGVRNANLLSYAYGADMQGRTIHSLYLQIAADSGFPALAFYLTTFFIAWRSLRRFQKQNREQISLDHQFAYNLACGLEGAITVFCVGAMFLSLETFELPYLLNLLALRLPVSLPGNEVICNSDEASQFEHAEIGAKSIATDLL
jgi:probable O-glycosylation ligase (exosortase A-associated)